MMAGGEDQEKESKHERKGKVTEEYRGNRDG